MSREIIFLFFSWQGFWEKFFLFLRQDLCQDQGKSEKKIKKDQKRSKRIKKDPSLDHKRSLFDPRRSPLGGAFNVSPLISYHRGFPTQESEGQPTAARIFNMDFFIFFPWHDPKEKFFQFGSNRKKNFVVVHPQRSKLHNRRRCTSMDMTGTPRNF